MEQTPEGLAAAKAVREAAKRKREELDEEEGASTAPSTKRTAQPAAPAHGKACTHEVEVPQGFDTEAHERTLEPTVYGQCVKLPCRRPLPGAGRRMRSGPALGLTTRPPLPLHCGCCRHAPAADILRRARQDVPLHAGPLPSSCGGLPGEGLAPTAGCGVPPRQPPALVQGLAPWQLDPKGPPG